MKVYRIQDENGDGPFNTAKVRAGYSPNCLHLYGMPSPMEEFKSLRKFLRLSRDERRTYRFAFPSLDKLQEWVTAEDMKYLRAYGFGVIEMDVEPFCASETQVVFKLSA